MKIKFHHIIIALLLTASGCKKDNYAAPSSTLKGHLTYKGAAIGVEFDKVPFELYQPGFGKTGAIKGTFAQDGEYSTLLFNGNYKFTIPANQGPFIWKELSAGKRDTLAIAVSGNQTQDIEVTPYYMLRDVKVTVANKQVTALFNIEKIITDANAKNIEKVIVYINKTQFVSNTDQIASAELAGSAITSMNNVSLTAAIPSISPTQNYVFVRVALRIAGVEDAIYSPLVKINY